MNRSLLLVLALSGCFTVTPGTVVLEVPVCSAEIQPRVIRQGRIWTAFSACTDYYAIPSREQRAAWARANTLGTVTRGEGEAGDSSLTFAGNDGQKVNVDVGVGYAISPDDAEILKMVQTFGYNIEGIVHSRVRDSVRNALNMCASSMGVEEIYGLKKEELFRCAEAKVKEEYNPKGLLITQLTLNSEVRLPDQVQKAMEASTAATQDAQRVEREVASAEAEGKKTIVTAKAAAEARLAGANAEAEANRIIASSITPGLITMRELEIKMKQAEKWNGQLPTVQGGGGESAMIMDLGTISAAR